MDREKDLQVSSEDNSMEVAYQKYRNLKKIIKQWQIEHKDDLLQVVEIADNPPFLPAKDMPLAEIIKLWQKLNNYAQINISDSKLGDIWQKVVINADTLEEEVDQELLLHLQMAIKGIAQLVSNKINQDNFDKASLFGELNCPICGETSTMTVLKPPNGNRNIHCLVCDFERPFRRTGCIYCGNTEAKSFVYLQNELFPGVELVVCKVCGQYFKEIDTRHLIVDDYFWEDLRTLPLNFAVENWWQENKSKDDEIH